MYWTASPVLLAMFIILSLSLWWQSLRSYFTQFHLKHWFSGDPNSGPQHCTINTLLTVLPLQLHYLDFWLPQFLWFSFLKKKLFLNIQENVKGYLLSTDKVKHIKILTSEFMIQSQHRRLHWKHSSIISFPPSLIKSDYTVEVGIVSDNLCMQTLMQICTLRFTAIWTALLRLLSLRK